MMNRVDLLELLLQFAQPLSEIVSPLNTFGWDSDSALVILDRQQVASVLRRYLSGELSPSDVENWANAIEGREDVGYESGFEEVIDKVIYELANPLLTRPLSNDSGREWLTQLSGSTPATATA